MSKLTDMFIAFPNVVLQELWYRLLKEAIAGWQKFTGRTCTCTCTSICSLHVYLHVYLHVEYMYMYMYI